MSKQLTNQKFIYKIRSSRLREARWKLTLPLREARENDEVISVGDSQIMRWIYEIRGIGDIDSDVRSVRKEIKQVRNQPVSKENLSRIRKLYAKLDSMQFVPDYIEVIMDKDKDYRRSCKGFTVNDIRYVRLLGTTGGVKNSTIVFVNEDIAPEIRRRIDNGRDESVKFVPAKLEAYKALVCSGSAPVSMPSGIAVVNDCETSFVEKVVKIGWGDGDEPVMCGPVDEEVKLDCSDGFGIMLPSLARRWSEDLKLDYVISGCNTRFN